MKIQNKIYFFLGGGMGLGKGGGLGWGGRGGGVPVGGDRVDVNEELKFL